MNKAADDSTSVKKEFNTKDAILVFSIFSLLCTVVIFALISNDVLSLQNYLLFDKPFTLIMTTALAAIGLLLLGIILTVYMPSQYVNDTNKSYQNLSLMTILVFMFVGALFEELLFRGIIQNVLNLFIDNSWIAIIITTLLFVAIHVHYFNKPIMLLNIAVPGLVFGWTYAATSNLLVPFLVHFILNVAITLLVKYNIIKMRN